MCPLVSVIVPVYQTEDYIKKCIDSILSQTYKNFELIIVNDGSTDSSKNIIEDYVHQDKRVKAIHQENLGLSSARNSGLKFAYGDYVIFVDSDDWLDINTVEDLVTLLKLTNADIVVPKKNIFVDEKIKYFVEVELFDASSFNQHEPTDYVVEVLLGQGRNWSVTRGALYRKDIIDMWGIKFPEGLTAEDIVFNLRYFCHVKKIVLNHSAHYYYLKRKGSISHSYNKRLIDNYLYIDLEVIKYVELCCGNSKRAQLARDSLLTRNVVLYLSQFVSAERYKTFFIKRKELIQLLSSARIAEAFRNNSFINPYWPSHLKKYYIVFVRWLLSKRLYTFAIIIAIIAGYFYKWKRA